MKREKIIYPVLLIIIIALASTGAYLYIVNSNQNVSLDQNQAAALERYAEDMYTQTRNLAQSLFRYYEYTQGDQNTPNMTQDFLITLEQRSFILLSYEASSAGDIIQTDSLTLTSFDVNHGPQFRAYDDAYYNVSETVNYTVNQLDWTNGRLPSEHNRTMYELCHLLGADQYEPTGNTTTTRNIQNFLQNLPLLGQ